MNVMPYSSFFFFATSFNLNSAGLKEMSASGLLVKMWNSKTSPISTHLSSVKRNLLGNQPPCFLLPLLTLHHPSPQQRKLWLTKGFSILAQYGFPLLATFFMLPSTYIILTSKYCDAPSPGPLHLTYTPRCWWLRPVLVTRLCRPTLQIDLGRFYSNLEWGEKQSP
jgi:hypothetical protein